MRIITLYCDEVYKAYAEKLIESGRTFGYEIHATEFSFKDWRDISTAKVKLIQSEYRKHKGPLLYLDSDCEVVKPLDGLFHKISKHDLTIRHRYLVDRYNAGVIGLGLNYVRVLSFLDRWLEYSKTNAKHFPTLEQKCLERIVDTSSPRLKIYDLPYKFNFLPGDPAEYDKEDAVILHHKMSRNSEKVRAWRHTFYRNGHKKPKGVV